MQERRRFQSRACLLEVTDAEAAAYEALKASTEAGTAVTTAAQAPALPSTPSSQPAAGQVQRQQEQHARPASLRRRLGFLEEQERVQQRWLALKLGQERHDGDGGKGLRIW